MQINTSYSPAVAWRTCGPRAAINGVAQKSAVNLKLAIVLEKNMIAASSVLYYYTSPFHYMTGNLTPATFDHHILFMLCLIHTETQSGQNKVGFASSWSGKPQSIKLCSDLSIREKKKDWNTGNLFLKSYHWSVKIA